MAKSSAVINTTAIVTSTQRPSIPTLGTLTWSWWLWPPGRSWWWWSCVVRGGARQGQRLAQQVRHPVDGLLVAGQVAVPQGRLGVVVGRFGLPQQSGHVAGGRRATVGRRCRVAVGRRRRAEVGEELGQRPLHRLGEDRPVPVGRGDELELGELRRARALHVQRPDVEERLLDRYEQQAALDQFRASGVEQRALPGELGRAVDQGVDLVRPLHHLPRRHRVGLEAPVLAGVALRHHERRQVG